jgi:hypothetical protein
MNKIYNVSEAISLKGQCQDILDLDSRAKAFLKSALLFNHDFCAWRVNDTACKTNSLQTFC